MFLTSSYLTMENRFNRTTSWGDAKVYSNCSRLCRSSNCVTLRGLSFSLAFLPLPLLTCLGGRLEISRLLSLPGSHTEVFSSHEHPARLTHSVLAFRLLGGLERVARLCLRHGLELHHKQLGIVAHVCICNTWKLRQADPAWS